MAIGHNLGGDRYDQLEQTTLRDMLANIAGAMQGPGGNLLLGVLQRLGLNPDGSSSAQASYSPMDWGGALREITGQTDPTAATRAGIGQWADAFRGELGTGMANLLPGGMTALAQNLRGRTGEVRPSDSAIQAALAPLAYQMSTYALDPMKRGVEGWMAAKNAAYLQQLQSAQSGANSFLQAVLQLAGQQPNWVKWSEPQNAYAPPAQSPTSGGGSGSGGSGQQTLGLYEQMIAAQNKQAKADSDWAYMQNLGMAYSGLPKSSTYGGMRDTSGMYNNVYDYSGYA